MLRGQGATGSGMIDCLFDGSVNFDYNKAISTTINLPERLENGISETI